MNSMISFFVWLYMGALALLMFYGLHRFWILFLYWKYHKRKSVVPVKPFLPDSWRPFVTVQLPLFNEQYVAERLIDAVAAFDYPREAFEIQVLDDSTDETLPLVEKKVSQLQKMGIQIHHLRRADRTGFKAGALSAGLLSAKGEFVAIFDADFLPPPSFLKSTLAHFQNPLSHEPTKPTKPCPDTWD